MRNTKCREKPDGSRRKCGSSFPPTMEPLNYPSFSSVQSRPLIGCFTPAKKKHTHTKKTNPSSSKRKENDVPQRKQGVQKNVFSPEKGPQPSSPRVGRKSPLRGANVTDMAMDGVASFPSHTHTHRSPPPPHGGSEEKETGKKVEGLAHGKEVTRLIRLRARERWNYDDKEQNGYLEEVMGKTKLACWPAARTGTREGMER